MIIHSDGANRDGVGILVLPPGDPPLHPPNQEGFRRRRGARQAEVGIYVDEFEGRWRIGQQWR